MAIKTLTHALKDERDEDVKATINKALERASLVIG